MKFTDFFKPRWKHSDPKIRAEAIKELEPEYHLEELVNTVLTDPFVENCKLALKKISSEEALEKVMHGTEDKTLNELAQRKLNEIWTRDVKKSGEAEAAERLLDRITDQKCLEDVALSHKNPEIREKSLARLSNPVSFYKVALNENKENLALIALDRVVKQSHIETLSKKAHCKAVKQRAKEMTKGHSEKAMPPESQIISAKFELLCQTMESLLSAHDWKEAEIKAKEAGEAWEQLLSSHSAVVNAGIVERFQGARDNFLEKSLAHRQKMVEKQNEEWTLKENHNGKIEICTAVDVLMKKANTKERNKEIISLIDKWDQTGKTWEEEEQRVSLQFQHILDPFYKQLEEQKKLEARESKIKNLLERVQLQTENQNPHECRKILEEVQKEWGDMNIQDSHPLNEQFHKAVGEIDGTLNELHRKQLVSQSENLGKMEELVPKLEELIDNSDIISAEKDYRDLVSTWKTLDVFDVPEEQLISEYSALRSRYQNACNRFKEAQEWLRWANLKKKQDICSRLKDLIGQENEPKNLFHKMREFQVEWKNVGPVSWDSSKDIWDEYRLLIDNIYEICQDYFSELVEEKKANLSEKETLCNLVEVQIQNENWKDSPELVKEAQANWKNIGPVPKEKSDEIWERFRNACDLYFSRRKEYFEDLNKEKDGNYSKKVELCELVESLQDSTKWREVAETIKKAQEDWKHVGPVPKDQMEAIWERFRNACDYFFSRRETYFKELSAKKAENLVKKEALCEQAEALDQIENDSEKFNSIKILQARWKEIGPVDRDKMDAVWERFRKPIDLFFEKRKQHFEEQRKFREENFEKKQKLCEEAETLADSKRWKETSEKLKALQASWKEIGPAPREKDKEIWNRFRSACDSFFNQMKDHYRQLDDQRELNLRTKEDLCFQAEQLAGIDKSEDTPDLLGIDWNDASHKIKELQRIWKQTGPVPKARSDELWHRFRAACDYVFDCARVNADNELGNLEANLDARNEICEEAERISKQVHTDTQIQKIKDLQREWKSIGPVTREHYTHLWTRFREACEVVFAADERLRD